MGGAMGRYLRVALSVLLSAHLCGGQSGFANPVVVSSGQQIIDAKTISGSDSLSVSKGATAVIDFGQASNLNITGNIQNYGSIYAVSSNPTVHTAALTGYNITNNTGALMSTVLPAGGFAGLNNLVPNLNLSLAAVNNITNYGSISSAANLTMNAGNSIVNAGTMTAAQNVNIITGIAGLINSGTISSIMSNINISNLASQNTLINNTNGTLQALLGQINISTVASSALDKLNIDIIGGDLLSKELNINTQNGTIKANVGQLTGVLNANGGEFYASAKTPNLRVGSINMSGDPIIASTGNVDITASVNSAANIAYIAGGNIDTNGAAAPISINTSSAGNAGSVLMLAGVNYTANGDGSYTITPGNGGSIDLTNAVAGNQGINTFNTSSSNNGSGGNVVLVAYNGSISVPSNVTITTGAGPNNQGFTVNGNVTIIAGAASGNAVSVGGINTSGNTISPQIFNGYVSIYNSNPAMYQSANQQDAPTAWTQLNGAQSATQQYLVVNDTRNISSGNTLYMNIQGANPEAISISAVTPNTPLPPAGQPVPGTISLNNALHQNHGSAEILSTSVSTLNVAPAASSPSGQLFSNGAMFGPAITNGAVASNGGTISVGQITSGGNVVIGAGVSNGGSVSLNGNISLTQAAFTAPTPANYNDTPVVQVSGQNVHVVGSSTTVSSAISSCSFCQDQLNIYTQKLSNAGTISGTFVNITNPIASTLTVANSGTISGINPGSTAGNPWVNIQSAGGVTFTSTAPNTANISVPNYGVISVSAADTNAINFSNSSNFTGGNGGLITFSAQGTGASLNVAANSILSISPANPGFGGPVLSVSCPNINLGNAASIQGPASNMIFTSGSLVQSPQALTITVASGSAQIFSGATNTMVFRPTDGQNINFIAQKNGANLAFTGGSTYLFTGTNKNTKAAGSVQYTSGNINVTCANCFNAVDPNGSIKGIAFQPYVGPAITFPSAFTAFATYTYPQVLLLMAPIAQTGLFTNLGTYSQGSFIGAGNPPVGVASSYVITGASKYTIQAAKQMGFTVTAGAYSQNLDHSVNVVPTEVEINFALQQAKSYGNVLDLVVGNECIIGDANKNIATSMGYLITAINYAQTQRNALGFSASTLPVTTRQIAGVLSGVNSSKYDLMPQTRNLLVGCQNCYGIANFAGVDGHVYADVYPYYDGTDNTGGLNANSVVGYLVPGGLGATSITAISKSDFNILVTNANSLSPISNSTPPPAYGIQADMNGTISAFQAQSVGTQIWIAETGWATASTQPGNTQTTALPNNAPQANPTWAGYYFPAMQSWSYKNGGGTPTYQIAYINGYFESYDEPWKYTTTSWQGGEPNFGLWTATGTNLTAFATAAAQYQLSGIAQKFNLPVFNQQPGLPAAQPPTITVSATAPAPTATLSSAPLVDTSALLASSNLLSSSIRSNTTILPTDINPELKASNEASTKNQNANGSLTNGANNTTTTMLGNVLHNASMMGINPAGDMITFEGTNLLLAPDHNLTVNTNLADIQLDAGAAVMMLQTGNELAILALHDDHSGAVKVTVGNQSMEIPVGRQLVLSKDQETAFDNLNPSAIGYRNLSDGKMGTLKAYTSEFSLPTALSTAAPIRQLIKSSEKEERDLARKLLKTAAAMAILSKNKAPFKSSH